MRIAIVGSAACRCADRLLQGQLPKLAFGDEVDDAPGRWIAVLKSHRFGEHLDLLDRLWRQIADLLIS
ncbi:hypothetical protein QP166_02565 [Sphingomonas sp. LR60]|uniref:hypothetical protein n=1 Tax=Sphingomonas sp. LR60 TaxID=3050233 RepID=UPI002FE1ED0D